MTPTAAVLTRISDLSSDDLPAYLYDLAALRSHAATIRAAIPARVELYYAAKANPEPPILTALRGYVTGYEVSSGGEMAHVRRTVPELPVAFGGPAKTPAEITAALRAGVELFHVESEYELRLLDTLVAALIPGRSIDVLLRANLPVPQGTLRSASLAMGGSPTPFGLDPDQVECCLAVLARLPRLRFRGIHTHLASGLDADAHLSLASEVITWATQLAERRRIPVSEINIGGGMAVDYSQPETRFEWDRFGAGLDRLAAAHPELTLRIEPGRALTAYCGWYATEVLDIKHSHGREFALIRGGTHHLRTPVTKQHNQPFTILPVNQWPYSWKRPSLQHTEVTLAGQLCTPKDVLAHQIPVTSLRAADRVVFGLAGAYAWNISHHEFLMHPHPSFHFIDP
ncbi:diaminopimelate decarboxylase [Nocardia sp. GAS34]|uniref:type III PLP-dependent enzyme n=1 Tax=unclassified Nocardia TaxID=2637762 RepID=UPI003D1C188A